MLGRIDQARPQVMIEAKVIEFQDGSDQALGVTWNFAPGGTTAGIKLATPSSPTHGTFSDIVFGRISRSDINLDGHARRGNSREQSPSSRGSQDTRLGRP